MRTLLFLLVTVLLSAQSGERCYTVELEKISNFTQNSQKLLKNIYPDNCGMIVFNNILVVQCGCYESKSVAKKNLYRLKKNYKNATLTRKTKKQKQMETRNIKDLLKKDDEELKLILQVFLYKGDIEMAYKVASLGYNQHKNSYYWNKKMADICKWTNRSARSMKHLRFLYSVKYDKAIEDELIKYGTESYQYTDIEPLVVNRALLHPTEENIDLMIYVFKEIGNPEKVIRFLEGEYYKDTNNTMFLTKALSLSLEFGDMKSATKYVKIIESKKPYTQKDAALLADYYYVKSDINRAYKSLSYVDKLNITNEADNIKYYQLKSDLGWYLQDNKEAAIASKELMKLNRARLTDYERILSVFQDIDPKLAGKAAKKSFLKFKLPYLFYAYANHALLHKQVDELNKIIKKLEKDNKPIIKQAEFWIIKSRVYKYYKEPELEEEALLYALSLNPNSYSMRLQILFFYIESNNSEKLKAFLSNIDTFQLDSSFYFPIASAYFQLNNINRASFYTQKLLALDDPITKSLQFRFMQAYLYQAQSNQESFMEYMKDIFLELKKEAKTNPKNKQQKQFLSNYLSAAIYILSADKFKKELKEAKKYLKKATYQDIAYSFALRHNAYDKGSKIFHKIRKKALWLLFSNSMVSNNHSTIGNLLISKLKKLSSAEASTAAFNDGQQSLAQSLAFNTFVNNDSNQNSYMQHLDSAKNRSDILNIRVTNNDKKPLSQNSFSIDNSLYFNNAYYINTGVTYYENRTSKENEILNLEPQNLDANFGIKKIFNKGYFQTDIEFYSAIYKYFGFTFNGNYRLSTDLITNLMIGKNQKATEGNELFLGGKKDIVSINLIWSILPSTAINFLYEKYNYSSQDEVDIGDGEYSKISVDYQIRNGYPDLKVAVFYDQGTYNETEGSRGVMDRLTEKISTVLPAKPFYNIGVSFSYGMANSSGYTRVWRPYFELSPYYNSVTEEYTYGYSIGYGGKIFHQDHLSLGIIYTESTNPKENPIYEFYINYKFMYKHPKL